MKRQEAERRGRKGEGFAAFWLRLHGWKVVARRIKTPRGEIDLIARRGHTLAFIEVKWRATAAERDISIDDYRLRRVAVAAERLQARYARPGDLVRIDAIFLVPGRWPRHLANVWSG